MATTVAFAVAAFFPIDAVTPVCPAPVTPEPITQLVPIEVPMKPDPGTLSHAQETWISALEWCESQGKPSAINPLDNDGTPSYYSFQFKPGTFRAFGEQYDIIGKGKSHEEILSLMQVTELQRAIVRRMIKDKNVRIETQFPACVRQLGRPPVY